MADKSHKERILKRPPTIIIRNIIINKLKQFIFVLYKQFCI
jgi:hypothetical protein